MCQLICLAQPCGNGIGNGLGLEPKDPGYAALEKKYNTRVIVGVVLAILIMIVGILAQQQVIPGVPLDGAVALIGVPAMFLFCDLIAGCLIALQCPCDL